MTIRNILGRLSRLERRREVVSDRGLPRCFWDVLSGTIGPDELDDAEKELLEEVLSQVPSEVPDSVEQAIAEATETPEIADPI